MNAQERNDLEFIAMKSLFSSDVFFDTIIKKYSDIEGVFRLSFHKDIIKSMFDLYKKQKRKPTLNDMYNFLSGELQKHFQDYIIKAQYTHKDIFIDLINDNLEVKANYIQAECRHLKGLEYITEIQNSYTELLNNLGIYKQSESNESRVDRVVTEIGLIRNDKNFSRYIPTGYQDLDEKIIGFKKGGVTIVAGRPGQAKTTLTLNFKQNFINQGFRPLFFSVEMPSEDLTYKDLSYHSGINSMKIESGDLSDLEYEEIKGTAEILKGQDYIYVDDTNQTMEKICSRTRQEILKGKVDVILIDYLTLIDMSYSDNHHLSVEKGMKILTNFAKEADIPILLLSQLNRKVEERPNKVPMLSDLRASGSIEQDAMQILFLYRPHYYFPNEPLQDDKLITDDNEPLKAEEALRVIVAKARGGKTGDVMLHYIKEIQKINNCRKRSLCDYDFEAVENR